VKLSGKKNSSSGNKNLHLGAYYRPPSDKGESLEQLNTSLYRACNKKNSFIWLSGDFNLGLSSYT